MMNTALFFGAGNSIFEVSKSQSKWTLTEKEVAYEFHCLAVDRDAGRLYGGTFDNGLWFSDDRGRTCLQ